MATRRRVNPSHEMGEGFGQGSVDKTVESLSKALNEKAAVVDLQSTTRKVSFSGQIFSDGHNFITKSYAMKPEDRRYMVILPSIMNVLLFNDENAIANSWYCDKKKKKKIRR